MINNQTGSFHIIAIVVLLLALFGVYALMQSYRQGTVDKDMMAAFEMYKSLALKAAGSQTDKESIESATSVNQVDSVLSKYTGEIQSSQNGQRLMDRLNELKRHMENSIQDADGNTRR